MSQTWTLHHARHCRQEENGKNKENIAQEDISSDTASGMGTSVGQVGQHQQGHVMHVHEQSRLYDSMKWQAEASAVFHRHVPSPVQAIAVLQEIESSTPGNKIQIVYERQADITPEALAELIEQACFCELLKIYS